MTIRILLTEEDPEGYGEVTHLGVFASREAAMAFANDRERAAYAGFPQDLEERLQDVRSDTPIAWGYNDADSCEAKDEGATGSSLYCYRMYEVNVY